MMGLGLVGILGAVLVGVAPTEAAIAVTPSEGAHGTQVTINQTEFASDEPCDIVSATLGIQPVDVTSGDPGTASFVVPASVGTGDQDVRATCEDGTLAGSASFRVIDSVTTTTANHGTTTVAVSPDSTMSGPPADGEGDDVPDDEENEPVAPPRTPPPVDEPSDVPQTIEECEEQAAMSESRLVYEPERRMTVGDADEVLVALSLDELSPDVTFGSPTTVVVVPDARCTIEAVLSGAHFDISPDEPVAQSFLGTRVLVWEWEVTPTRPGEDHELNVRLQAKVVEEGREVPGREILEEAVIDVDAAPRSWSSVLSGWLRDIFGHPAVPVAVVPAAGAVYVALRRRLGRRRPTTAVPGRTSVQH